jgi:peroxiredoxin
MFNQIRLASLLLALLALGSLPARAEAGPRLKAGDSAADFTLLDLSGKEWKLGELGKGRIVVLEWFSPECPISAGYHTPQGEAASAVLEGTYGQLAGDDLVWVAINSVSPDADGNSLAENQRFFDEAGTQYPLLFDGDFAVAAAYGAKATPDIFIIDQEGRIAYSGAVDADPDEEHPEGINYIVDAVTALRAGEAPAVAETEPYGCPL